MENRELKFNPEFSFLEDRNILELDNMINELISSEIKPKEKDVLFEKLIDNWNKIQKEYLKKDDNDSVDIKNFLNFVSYNIRKMSAGGMNIGRSKISDFISEKSEELIPFFNKFRENL